jgi:hypothetical protein
MTPLRLAQHNYWSALDRELVRLALEGSESELRIALQRRDARAPLRVVRCNADMHPGPNQCDLPRSACTG